MAVAGERGDIGVGTEPAAAKIDQDNDTMSGTREGEDVVEEICGLLESISQLGEYRRCFRRECHGLARRIKLLSPFLEEVKDAQYDDGGVLPDQAVRFLVTLKEAVLFGEKLLKTCHGGSKIFLVVEQEAIMTRFHRAHDLLCKALLGVPYDELGISDEVKEQVELLRVQLARARRGTDTQDMELAMDLMAVFSEDNEHNLDRAIVERLAKKLELSTVEDLKAETIAVKNIVNERGGGEHREPVDQIIDLLNKLKQVLGVEVTDVISDPVGPKTLRKCPSVVIPYEFLCPITLSIMTDPVIIASGQTYERESIQKWFDSNHRTCPQTRQTLAHLSLAPNYALKNLIEQWCEKNNYPLPAKDVPSSSKGAAVENTEAICSLVKDLSSKSLDVQREAVKKVRVLSRENSDCRSLIADKGGITPLIQLLSYPDSKIQENAVTSLLNLSLNEANKKLIARKEAIPAIIEVLQKGSTEAKENAAAALFSLSMVDENKVMVGSCNGIPPLVHLLEHGTVRGKRDAAYALFNLSLNNANKGAAIDAGIVPPLLELLKDKNLGMVDEALSILLLLAAHPRGRTVIGQLSFIETLVSFIADGTPKNKECAASVLLELGSKNSSLLLAALQFSVYDRLVEISNTGTNRAKRKAAALLGLISKTEQI